MKTAKEITVRDIKEIYSLFADDVFMQYLGIDEKKILIMQMVWIKNLNFEQIAVTLNDTPANIKNRYDKAFHSIKWRINAVARLFDNYKKLSEENEELWHMIQFLKTWSGKIDLHEKRKINPLGERLLFPNYKIKLIDLDFSVRALNVLHNGLNIETIADLMDYTRKDLLKTRNFGKKTLNEIETLLENKFGLKLREE